MIDDCGGADPTFKPPTFVQGPCGEDVLVDDQVLTELRERAALYYFRVVCGADCDPGGTSVCKEGVR